MSHQRVKKKGLALTSSWLFACNMMVPTPCQEYSNVFLFFIMFAWYTLHQCSYSRKPS